MHRQQRPAWGPMPCHLSFHSDSSPKRGFVASSSSSPRMPTPSSFETEVASDFVSKNSDSRALLCCPKSQRRTRRTQHGRGEAGVRGKPSASFGGVAFIVPVRVVNSSPRVPSRKDFAFFSLVARLVSKHKSSSTWRFSSLARFVEVFFLLSFFSKDACVFSLQDSDEGSG